MQKMKFFSLFFVCILIIHSGLQAQDPNLKVYYNFDASEGTIVGDSSSNSHDATTNCPTCWESNGRFGGAFHFSGDQRVDLPAADIGLTTEKGTVAFWMLLPLSSKSTINCIWWAGEYGGDMFGPHNEMHINSELIETNIWNGGEIAFVIRDSLAGTGYFLFSDPWKGPNPATPPSENAISLADSNWHHVACTWEKGKNIALYLDGQAIWDTTAYNQNDWNCNLMTLGVANQRSNRKFSGYLDEFRLFNVALDATDIYDIFTLDPQENVSVAKTHSSELSIYPVPAINSLNFSRPLDEGKLEIYNIEGKKILSQAVINLDNISVEQLAAGIYLIRILNDNQVIFTSKFVKQ